MKLHALEVFEKMCHGHKTHIRNYIVERLENKCFEMIVMEIGEIGVTVRKLVVTVKKRERFRFKVVPVQITKVILKLKIVIKPNA